jgi:hypothetical protein
MKMTISNQLLNQKDMYQTADLALAAAIFLFYPLETIDKQNSRKALFIFERKDGLDELVERYWRGELVADLQAYFNALRVIKARLYGEE